MLLDNEPTPTLMPAVCQLAREAGDKIMEIYDQEFEVMRKADRTPLTAADMAAHRCIERGLRELTPELPVLSEESEHIPFSERGRWRRYWLVDPLDGTREFIKKNGEFTVNIALIDEHQPIMGVIYAPAIGLLYMASRGQGSWRQEATQQAPEAIHVNARKRHPVIAGSRSHGSERFQNMLSKIGQHRLISMGSSLKFGLVASGEADIYPRLGPTSEWDTAAAQCIVEEAGGRVVDLNFNPLRYNRRESLLNPDFLVLGGLERDWAAVL